MSPRPRRGGGRRGARRPRGPEPPPASGSLVDLGRLLAGLEGRQYPGYKAARGSFHEEGLTLHVDRVQGDPFAAPSRLRGVLDPAEAQLPEWALSTPQRRVSCADFLLRRFVVALRKESSRKGSGKSGELSVPAPGPCVLARSCLRVHADGSVEARFTAGLPARGRRILGHEAAELLTGDVPAALDALCFPALDADALRAHLDTVEDAQALRAQLEDRGLVAFVAEGAVLPRRSGVDPAPLPGAVPFAPPAGLSVTLEAPHAGALRGLGVRRGVTLITGGGYHGKSTVLRALEHGVYDHVPGDGRERVVSLADAVKIRAEDGRAVRRTDISAFISNLPGDLDTRAFSTDNASGSTSQAAAIAEALEVGTRCLLIDEDTSATNFMIRDARMQALVPAAREPITPFLDRVRQLADAGVSSVVVIGGSGDYLDVADTVLTLEAYRPRDATAAAREVAARLPTQREVQPGSWSAPRPRGLDPASLDARRGRREVALKVPTLDRLLFGEDEVHVAAVEQLVELGQLRAIGHALAWLQRTAREPLELRDAVARAQAELERDGPEAFLRGAPESGLAEFRAQELAAVLNRLRSLRVN